MGVYVFVHVITLSLCVFRRRYGEQRSFPSRFIGISTAGSQIVLLSNEMNLFDSFESIYLRMCICNMCLHLCVCVYSRWCGEIGVLFEWRLDMSMCLNTQLVFVCVHVCTLKYVYICIETYTRTHTRTHS